MKDTHSKTTAEQETVYIVENLVSDAAKETVLDKVRKLILRDAEGLSKNQAV
ncbi:MAG: hypothetical protein E7201_05015 [Selenomonas ruminantium]|uniref:Uncharacterized protein n=1 Tax=Selenomonas ruminantium TaxID=971 RepID=A0A927WNZ1_SELRU|nr:hypothetical protein [Selenomonas ruminantium]